MALDPKKLDLSKLPKLPKVDRRSLLVGGGAGLGLLVAWSVWPRTYLANLTAAPGESVFGAWLKIATDGRVIVAIPQCEEGQGVYTALPQILADELGADWNMVGVEPAPLNPLYTNGMAADHLFASAFGGLPETLRRAHAARIHLTLTAGSTSVRNFEEPLRSAGAAARILLCKAAARRWGVDWQACTTRNGKVLHEQQQLGFGELASEAASESLPDDLPLREDETGRLLGQPLPRLDVPSKVRGSVNYAADIRLPNMVFAAIRQGPVGDSALVKLDRPAGDKIPGMLSVVQTDRWVVAVADNSWSAQRALDAMRPEFSEPEAVVNSDSIEQALTDAFSEGGLRVESRGDLRADFKGARIVQAEYRVGLAPHAPLEPMCCTASYKDGRLTLWLPTQAPGLARTAAAKAVGLSESDVVVHATMAGGSFGARLEHDVAVQAAIISSNLGRPVQLTWPRSEDLRADRFRPAAAGRLAAKLDDQGKITGWLTKIAAPETGREIAQRLLVDDRVASVTLSAEGRGEAAAVAGALPTYAIPNLAVDHHPAAIGVPTGYWRSAAHSYTAFFTESFIDELAHIAEEDALTLRIGMLAENPRLARCLQLVAQLGGWQGGGPGSGQGVACHSFAGSHIAVMAEARLDGRTVRVDRLVAAVDCGRIINPDLVKQQIEGGMLFGMAAALGASAAFTENVSDLSEYGALGLPTLATCPDISIELIASLSEPGGVSELGVPAVAPAIANALQSAIGVRSRRLPLLSDIE